MGDGAFDAGAGGVVPLPLVDFLELSPSADRFAFLARGRGESAWLGLRTGAFSPHCAGGAVVAVEEHAGPPVAGPLLVVGFPVDAAVPLGADSGVGVPVDEEAVDGEALVGPALPGDVLTDRVGQFDAVTVGAGGQQFGVDIASVDEVLTGQQLRLCLARRPRGRHPRRTRRERHQRPGRPPPPRTGELSFLRCWTPEPMAAAASERPIP